MLRYGMANEESATVPTPFHGQLKAVGKIKKLEKLFPSVYIACTRGVVGAPCWGFELKSAAKPFFFFHPFRLYGIQCRMNFFNSTRPLMILFSAVILDQ